MTELTERDKQKIEAGCIALGRVMHGLGRPITVEDYTKVVTAVLGLAGEIKNGDRGDLSLRQAIDILVDVHTKDDHQLGYTFVGVDPFPRCSQMEYAGAWGVIRKFAGCRTSPDEYPECVGR